MRYFITHIDARVNITVLDTIDNIVLAFLSKEIALR